MGGPDYADMQFIAKVGIPYFSARVTRWKARVITRYDFITESAVQTACVLSLFSKSNISLV